MIYYIKPSIILACIVTVSAIAGEYTRLMPHNNTLALSKDVRNYIKDGNIQALQEIARTSEVGSSILVYSKKLEKKYTDKKNTCCYNEKVANVITATASTIAFIETVTGIAGVALTIADNSLGIPLTGVGLVGLGSTFLSCIPIAIIRGNSRYAEKILQNQKSIQRFLQPEQN